MGIPSESSLKESKFVVEGMDCENEVSAVRTALETLSGIRKIEVSLISSRIDLWHDPSIPPTELVKRIESVGLRVKTNAQAESNFRGRLFGREIRVAVAGFFLGGGLIADWSAATPLIIVTVAYFLSILVGGSLVLPKALRGLKTFTLDMNVLMMVATVGAIAIGELAEGAAVVFLFALAEMLEGYSLERARRSIQSLLKLVPETALLLRNDSVEEVPVREVSVGSLIRARSGSRIPLDGEVISGASTVNQAPITGESLPVEKKSGDRVLAGTINGEGSLDIKVTRGHQDTKIAQIIRLIEDAQSKKAPTQRFVDTFAKYYTPTIFILAIAVLLVPPLFFGGEWQTWIYRSLVLLVIACPCALVIATPVSVVSGLTAMARRGILIKGGLGLELIGKLNALAVDKTGTITEGVPQVLEIHSLGKATPEELIGIAASIDLHSTHPLAKSVVSAARTQGVAIKPSVDYRAVNGRGAEAVIDGHVYFVGNHRFAHDFAVCSPELEERLQLMEDKAQSVVVVGHRPHSGCPGEVLGILGLGDAIRKDAKAAISELHSVGIQSVIMLSGDNQRTVDAISRQVGIDEAYGDLLPSDKVIQIKKLKERFGVVAMIGDGVNDAPAMASASLGIAMGASGTDTAIETSDITLMRDRLTGIAEAIRAGKRTLRVIWFNTGFALATKFLFLGLSLFGYSSLWLAIAADTGATLIVIANSLRLLRA